MWKGRELVVVDTPGIFDTEVQEADSRREIARCALLTSPGPHALVLVIPLGRYTVEEHKATEKILQMFGDRARRFMILLFTRKDDLGDLDFQDYLKEDPEGIRELVGKFHHRYCAFNNKATGPEQEAQKEQLLSLVQQVVRENEGGCFTNKMYQRAEEEIQKQVLAVQERYRAELEREKAQIRQEYEEKIRRLESELEREKRKVQMEMELVRKECLYASRQQKARVEVESQSGIVGLLLEVWKIVPYVIQLFMDD